MNTARLVRLCSPFLVLSLLVMPRSATGAAIFKCVDKDGEVTFSNTKCDDNAKPAIKGDKVRPRQTEEKASSPRSYELRSPTQDWVVVLDIPGYIVRTERTRPNQQRMMGAENEQTGMLLSIFLEREPQAMDARACRDRYWRRALQSPLPKTAIRSWETDTMALGQYRVEAVGGVQVRQKHVNAYMGVGDVCIDLHLSKVRYTDQDEPLFAAALESMRVKRTDPTPVAGQEVRRFPVLAFGTLEFSVPPSWRDEVGPSPAGLPPTILFQPGSGSDFKVLITPITPIPERNRSWSWSNPDELRRAVELKGQLALRTAVEDKIVLQEVRGPAAVGYFYSLTDKAPKPGEYEFMTQGLTSVGDLLLSATILSHTKDSQSVRDALSMLRGSRQTHAPPAGR